MSHSIAVTPVVRVLAWESARRTLPGLAVGICVLLILFLTIGFAVSGSSAAGPLQSADLFFTYIGIATLICGIGAWSGIIQGTDRLFVLPISTFRLASFQLTATSICIVGAYGFVTWTCNVSFSAGWPVLTVVLFLIALNTAGLAAYWSLQNFSCVKLLMWSALFAGGVYWFLTRFFRNGFRSEPTSWNSVSAGELIVLLTTAAAAWLFGIRSLSAWRRGETGHSRVREFFGRQLHTLFQADSIPYMRSAKNAEAALVDMLQLKNRPITVILTCGMGALLLMPLLLLTGRDSSPWEAMVMLCPVYGVLCGMLVGASMGATDRSGKRIGLPAHLTTLPLSDRAWGQAVTVCWLRSSLLSYGLLLAFVLLALVIGSLVNGPLSWPDRLRIRLLPEDYTTWSVLLFSGLLSPVLMWATGGFTTALALTGRRWAELVGNFVPIFILLVMLTLRAAMGSASLPANQLIMLGSAFASMAMVTVAFVACRRLGLLSVKRIAAAGMLALAVSVVLMMLLPEWGPVWASCAVLVGIWTTAPAATIPLALLWNRHR